MLDNTRDGESGDVVAFTSPGPTIESAVQDAAEDREPTDHEWCEGRGCAVCVPENDTRTSYTRVRR